MDDKMETNCGTTVDTRVYYFEVIASVQFSCPSQKIIFSAYRYLPSFTIVRIAMPLL